MTGNDTKLSSIFDNDKLIEEVAKKFIKVLNKIIHQCFKKIKITNNKTSKIDELFRKQKTFKSKTDKTSKKELNEIEKELADKMETQKQTKKKCKQCSNCYVR